MRLLNLTLINIKRQIKNPMMLAMGIILPLIMLITVNGKGDNVSTFNIGMLNKDNSIEGKQLIEKISENRTVNANLSDDFQENLEKVKSGEISDLFVIKEGFGEALKKGEILEVEVYRGTKGAVNLKIDTEVENFIKENLNNKEIREKEKNYIKTELVKDKVAKKDTLTMSVIMICYFMMISGSVIVEELIKLKKQKVLRRTVVAPNRDVEVIGSLMLSSFIIQGTLAVIAFKVVENIFKFKDVNSFGVILVLFLGSLISNSLILVVTRWIKNGGIASLVTVVVGLILFVLGNLSSSIELLENPPAFFKLGIISPFSWLMKILDKGEYFFPTLVILLMSAVLLTFGSFKIREFVKE